MRNEQWRLRLAIALTAILAATCTANSQQTGGVAAATGSIEFTARVQPTGGRPEPVRQLAIFLLRKSFAEIQTEAEKTEPKPDRDKFVESLSVSNELKAWMKRTRVVNFAGSEFMTALKVDDILEVPEFFEAYISQNAGDTAVGFPKSKAKDIDREKNPKKYEQDQQQYREAIRSFIAKNPHTREAMEVPLLEISPVYRWQQVEQEHKKRIRGRALQLAELNYAVARTETDMQGRGAFSNVPVGDYWLSSLEGEGVAGDVRLRWDARVSVAAGRIARAILSNVNAAK
jgi:hypothetical protein